METEVSKRLFTVEEYHRMGEAGIIHEDDRVELIDGEIIQMSPIGHHHFVSVTRATTFFIQAFGNRAVVSPQNPVRLSDWTEPQPDLVVFKPRADFYAKKKCTPEDVLFVVEVADTTLSYDRNIKVPRFAKAGIPEVWIEDLGHALLHVYRNPVGEAYQTVLVFRPGDSVSPLAFPETKFDVAQLLSIDCDPDV
jgi:Uma2 family endonuclease